MSKTKKIKSPTQMELVEPTFAALVKLGGSATVDEICEKVIELLELPDEIVDEPHRGNASQQTELEYQLAWARTRLKNYGAITNSKRGVWMITTDFADKTSVSRSAISEHIKKSRRAEKSKAESDILPENNDSSSGSGDIPEELEPWRTSLAEILHSMNPYAFERLTMLLLRECGFSQVRVTKKSGDRRNGQATY